MFRESFDERLIEDAAKEYENYPYKKKFTFYKYLQVYFEKMVRRHGDSRNQFRGWA